MSKGRFILFLDIDGILNRRNSHSFYSSESPDTYRIDESLWGYLRQFLASVPSANVVIHSDWTKYKDDTDYEWKPAPGVKFKTLLPEVIRRLGDRYIGCTEYLPGKSKLDRIRKWIEDNHFDAKNGDRAIVLDQDNTDFSRLAELDETDGVYVVFTDPNWGFNQYYCLQSVALAHLIYEDPIVLKNLLNRIVLGGRATSLVSNKEGKNN